MQNQRSDNEGGQIMRVQNKVYTNLILDVVCDYLQNEHILSDSEQQLFRKQWYLKESEINE